MEKILPFEINPLAKAYYLHAYTFGILQACGKDIMPWLMSDFVNFQYAANTDGMFIVHTIDTWSINKRIIYPQQIVMFSENITGENFDILKIIKNMINKKSYVYGFFNEYYVPGSNSYKKRNSDHDYLIYGYDDAKEVFYAAGYNKNNEYLSYNISYQDYLSSIRNTDHGITDIRFYTLDEKYNFSFDKKEFLIQLSDYIYGVNSYSYLVPNDACEYGLIACLRYAQYVDYCQKHKIKIDLRYSRSFWELKKLMLLRIKYLKDKQCLACSDIIMQYEQIEKAASVSHLACLKYDMSSGFCDLNATVDLINTTTEKERVLLKELLECCKTSL